MPKPLTFERSKLPPQERAVAQRLREVRKRGRFTIAQLASECGVSESNLKHYEQGDAPLPFDAGNRVCEVLNVNQRWLALGQKPEKPFFFPEELGSPPPKRTSLCEAFTGAFNDRMEKCLERAAGIRTSTVVVLGGPTPSLSLGELDGRFRKYATWFLDSGPKSRPNFLSALKMCLAEYERRIAAEKPIDASATLQHLTPVQIADRLKKKREELGLTRKQAAGKWGVSDRTLQSWEQGARRPRGLALKQLEQILREVDQPTG